MKKLWILPLLCIALSGCDSWFQKMEATEHGVMFRNLPPFLGGGISSKVLSPGELVFLFPWDTVIRINTASQDVTLGEGGQDQKELGDFMFTRALDGNEVALRVTVRYQIMSDSESLHKVVQQVGITNDDIRNLVVATVRARIRSDMNALTTANFIDENRRYQSVREAEKAVRESLKSYGINVLAIILDRFEFARLLADGTVDKEYQEKLNETQRKREETERERLRIDTIKAEGQQRFNQMQATVNRQIEEAKGFKKQAETKGAAYLQSRTNEAEAILTRGKAEVQGMIEKINALSGPGGEAILRLEIAKHLAAAGSKFLVLNEGKGDSSTSLGVNKVDVNELLQQVGVIEGLAEKKAEAPREKKSE
ncbi:MAG: hypothetical protein GYA55_08500 [SAR324 cluster bacterium]|uniref:Band 7 domain-containing protein n=1 Tax=SAR324 cluster bacterium TaxID=2024889 RepID=A0A7X9FSA1_9DELT|nr:hypothetical protein [SAR324 cluster bacterium]